MSSYDFEVPPSMGTVYGTTDGDYFGDFEEYEEEIKSLGLQPEEATVAKPGSEEKVAMLAARYASGLPLWHGEDCYDHGPGSISNLVLDNGFEGEADDGE